MKKLCGALLVLTAGLLLAAPPKQGRELTAEEQKEVARLFAEANQHVKACRFEDVAKVLTRVVDYRAERQGANYWQVIDARLNVERWQWLAKVPEKDRAEVVRATIVAAAGNQLQGRLRYREAEAKFRESLAICRKVLGEQHPETALSYNNVALLLYRQGKLAEALSLSQKALSIFQKVLGEQHVATVTACNNVAFCLHRQGKYAEALPLYQKARAIRQKVLGEQHPDTAESYNNLAQWYDHQDRHADALPLFRKALALYRELRGEDHIVTAQCSNNLAACLKGQGKPAEALPLFQKALAISRKVLGELHPNTAASYNNLAYCLCNQARTAEALPLFRKALAIHLKLGEHHAGTADSYNGVAMCLHSQGNYAAAVRMYQKALALRRQVLGERHSDTAASYNNLAACLMEQGKYAEALLLCQKAVTICLQVLGEQHARTAQSYNNLAVCLDDQGKHADALPLHQKALAISRQVYGEQHRHTAICYNNLASCLTGQNKHTEALPNYARALAIRRSVLGEQHPDTAQGYNNVALCLSMQGHHAEALHLYQKALAIDRRLLGEQHPDTALGYGNVADCLDRAGKHNEAVRYWEKALVGSEWGRLHASATGFDRSLFQSDLVSPRASLAACLVRLGKPLEAWQHAEADLARGLLDDLLPATETSDPSGRRARLRWLDQTLLPLLVLQKPDTEQLKQREALVKERARLLTELAAQAARHLRERVLSLDRIQKQLPTDVALIFWLDLRSEHLGCVLRRQGPPIWERLPGSAKDKSWTDDDASLPWRALGALADSRDDPGTRRRLLAQLRRQRLAPLDPHLKGVRHLLIVPTGQMSAVPVEALTRRFTVSYVSSASLFARQAEQHRPLQTASLLVLADPTFERAAPALPPAPSHGLLILALAPRSLAGRIGLRPGDVLLECSGKKLTALADLAPAKDAERVSLKLWREGKTLAGRIPAGPLGVIADKRPIEEALAAWRKQESDLLALGRGGDWQPLPGTRLEARALAALVPKTTVLFGSDASQQKLTELADDDRLKDFRLLHLATHGQANAAQPKLTALILAQDQIDDANTAARAVLAGQRPVDGRLTVGTILADWKLDADLVVLSACQTGLGTDTRGSEGMLGFTQALLQKGARSVVLSRWKVDDAATALLMARFYENLLGARKGTKPLGRAAALAEAKAWLRGLDRAEATRRLAVLVDGMPRGERGSIKAALPTRKPDAPRGDDRPFAAPYYWAAFVLIGDPN